jgi:lipopolysaccharide/colanic/teichoic acid biosynthesis glycosyltransferase
VKRLFDIVASFFGLLASSPVLLPVMFLIWKQDGHSPFYVAPRTGKDEKPFKMIKLRSMVTNADKSGVDSTGAKDQRITPLGHFIRKYKLDELTQLWNVFKGDMSLVGPRPNVKRETDLYTTVEKKLLTVKPGITDFASIVFSDEGDILKDQIDTDIAYNQLIRPGKGFLGIFYIENTSILLDIKICFITVIAVFSRRKALDLVVDILNELGANEDLLNLASRDKPLIPIPPPGASEIVITRNGSISAL